MKTITVHASCVAFGSRAILIRGQPGSGKSDLVMQLIDGQGYGLGTKLLRAKLVVDDQVLLTCVKDDIFATAPDILKGKLEIRGRGIVSAPHSKSAKLLGVVDLQTRAEIVRMPEPEDMHVEILERSFPRCFIDPSAPSAAARIRSFFTEILST
jgi:serine kinase of HPr protein (carbohydrate metabolism regulator)